jgi:hypothetical protein
MAPRDQHNVDIVPDTNDNWHGWGQLVVDWITGAAITPDHIGNVNGLPGVPARSLRKQTLDRSIGARLVGSDNRHVKIEPYPSELFIPLPLQAMFQHDLDEIRGGAAQRPYPLPSFYDLIYNGPRRNLSADERQYIMTCRIGEYVINECM